MALKAAEDDLIASVCTEPGRTPQMLLQLGLRKYQVLYAFYVPNVHLRN